MKKISSLIIGIIWIVLAVFLIFFLCKLYKGNGLSDLTYIRAGFAEDKLSEYSFEANDIKEINVNVTSESLFVEAEDIKDFKVEIFSSVKNDSLPEVYSKNNTLYVVQQTYSNVNFNFLLTTTSTKVVIHVPKSVMQNQEIRIQSASGSIKIDDCKVNTIFIQHSSGGIDIEESSAKELTIKNRSGSIKLANVSATELSVANTSGSIKLEDLSADSVKISNTSGSIKLEDINAKDVSITNTSGGISTEQSEIDSIKIRNTSGSVNLNGVFCAANISVTSGSVRINNKATFTMPTSIKSKSGGVHLTFAENDGFTLNYNCTSGSVKNEFTGFSGKGSGKNVYKNGTTEIDIESTSGGVTVSRY